MANRIYFYDEAGVELDTPLSGASYGWCGSAMTIAGTLASEDGQSPKAEDARGRISRTEFSLSNDYGRRSERFVTIADFLGHDRVLVKSWWPAGSEWFWLVAGPTPVTDAKRLKPAMQTA